MKRGELWTVSGGADYAGKPRPALIVQNHRFEPVSAVTICPLTTSTADLPLLRLPIAPTPENGLRAASAVQIDRVSTVAIGKLGSRLGELTAEQMRGVSRALAAFLGLLG